ncbi:MAG TPA: (2Fe-2S) ferredoxin domain-containing protein [Polyangia bacterium]|jgi:(2Fe-2S) ferredoxin
MAPRIADPGQLKALRAQARESMDLREGLKDLRITVHLGTCGIAAGAREIITELMAQLTRAGVTDVTVRQAGCAGLCNEEPMLTLTDAAGREFRYGRLDRNRVRLIVEGHVLGGNPVAACLVSA